MLAPLIAKPFLGGPQIRIDDKTVLNSTYLDDLPEAFDSVNATRSPNTEDAVNRTIYPCLIVSLPLVLLGTLRFIFFLTDRGTLWRKDEILRKTQNAPLSQNIASNQVIKFLLSSLFFIVGIFVGAVELQWGGFGAAYVTKYHDWSGKNAAMIPFVFWIVYTFGRMVAVPVAKFVRPKWVFLICGFFLLISSVILLAIGESNDIVILVCCGLSGGFAGPFMAAGVTWSCDALGVTGLNSSLFLAGGALGAMFTTLITARLCESFGARMFSWTGFINSVVMFIVIIILCLMTRRQRTTRANLRDKENEYSLTINPTATQNM